MKPQVTAQIHPEVQTLKKTIVRRPPRVTPATADIHPDALIRKAQILGTNGTAPLLAIGNTRFYGLIAEGKLPKPRKIGTASFWRAGDILAALETL